MYCIVTYDIVPDTHRRGSPRHPHRRGPHVLQPPRSAPGSIPVVPISLTSPSTSTPTRNSSSAVRRPLPSSCAQPRSPARTHFKTYAFTDDEAVSTAHVVWNAINLTEPAAQKHPPLLWASARPSSSRRPRPLRRIAADPQGLSLFPLVALLRTRPQPDPPRPASYGANGCDPRSRGSEVAPGAAESCQPVTMGAGGRQAVPGAGP